MEWTSDSDHSYGKCGEEVRKPTTVSAVMKLKTSPRNCVVPSATGNGSGGCDCIRTRVHLFSRTVEDNCSFAANWHHPWQWHVFNSTEKRRDLALASGRDTKSRDRWRCEVIRKTSLIRTLLWYFLSQLQRIHVIVCKQRSFRRCFSQNRSGGVRLKSTNSEPDKNNKWRLHSRGYLFGVMSGSHAH